ncbi:MAG: PQQ-binding-like beta-propeller repeat protein [bacterium]|nr:PQQ-binding-like beta-propeller repeat protein [bacterium]
MKNRRPISHALPLALVAIFLLPPAGQAADWLQWGGPAGDFTVEVEGLAEWWPADGPETLWKRPLGEGYSSILHQGDRLFTMYRDGEHEVVVALEAGTGATIWEHRYVPDLWPDMTHAFGRGPNATPAIVGDRIVAIGISGQMRCLDLASGELLWKHDLPAEFGRRERVEEYGYSGSPLHYQGKIIVLVGGTDHGVVAFDPADGSVSWKSPPGGISYAPATLTTLGGRDQLVYFSPQGVVALDPSTGRLLWESPMEFNNGNHLTPIVKCDENHIWVGSQFPTGGGRLLEIRLEDGTWTANQVWFETYLRAAHWTSIRIGDFIYGSTGGNSLSVLTAFNWKTGEVAWRRRGFHKAQSLYADGKLLFLDEAGQLVLARISPTGLDVLASAEVTESVSWTLPTLVGTRLYLRDQAHILALDLAETGGVRHERRPDEPSLDESVLLGELGKLVRQIDGAENKKQLIDEFIARQEAFPIVEDDSLVHFVFRGDVPDVAVSGNFLERGRVEPLHLVPGTDFYFRSYRFPPAALFEYRFNIFDDGLPDPLNPRRLTDSGEGSSVLTTAGWIEPVHLREPTGARGRLETFTWASDILENEREIKVYLPPGYDADDERYPVVVVNYGDQALEQGKWANSLDNLIGGSVAPLIGVFLPRVSFDEYGPRLAQFTDAIARELIPYLDEHYRTLPGARNRAITGIASGGFASVFLALQAPELIGKVAVQSFYFREEAEAELRSLITAGSEATTFFYVEWSLNDLEIDQAGIHSEKHSRALAKLLGENGYGLVIHEVSDGAGWGSWRARTDRILESFFPLGD